MVRHGATDWSEEGRHTGWTDLPLNQRGLRQAGSLAAALQGHSFSTVLCSPLQRARQTCAAAGYAGVATIDPDLREWRYGDYEGLTTAEIRQGDPGWNIWDSGVKNGETIEQVAERAARVTERLRALDGEVAIFAHGHLLRILATCWIARSPRLAQNLALAAGSISSLGWEHSWPTITLWNDVAHLRAVD